MIWIILIEISPKVILYIFTYILHICIHIYFNDAENKPIELLISLERLKITNAQSIFNILNTIIHKLKLNWLSVLLICFDSAAAIASNISGDQSKKTRTLFCSLFKPCPCRFLNLV